MTDARILNREVVPNTILFAYACGHPFPGRLNLAFIRCPACTEEARLKKVRA